MIKTIYFYPDDNPPEMLGDLLTSVMFSGYDIIDIISQGDKLIIILEEYIEEEEEEKKEITEAEMRLQIKNLLAILDRRP